MAILRRKILELLMRPLLSSTRSLLLGVHLVHLGVGKLSPLRLSGDDLQTPSPLPMKASIAIEAGFRPIFFRPAHRSETQLCMLNASLAKKIAVFSKLDEVGPVDNRPSPD